MKKEIDMDYRMLGNTGILLSTLGFGCAAAWGKSVMGKEMISDEAAQRLLEYAYENGIIYFDTGFNYGFSEERLGRILKKSNVLERKNIVISTKFGENMVNGKWKMNWSPDWMRKSVKISMERMGIDYIDMLMCHGGKEDDFTEELFEAFNDMKKKGIIRAVGINTFSTETIEWVINTKKFDFVMLDYNFMKQERETLIVRLYEQGIGVIAGQPLAESLYSNRVFKIRELKDFWYLARAVVNFRKLFFKGRKFQFVNNIDGITGAQIALKYVIDNPYVSSAVFGTTTMRHLEENVEARKKEIPSYIKNRLKQQ